MSTKNVIDIKNLVKQFSVGEGYSTALQSIDLSLAEGEFVGLVGPSGSGKTTLLNIIGGLDSATHGSVNVLNKSIENTSHNERAEIRRKNMGFIFQSYNLLPVYTVYENVELPLILNNVEKTDRIKKVTQAIEWVGLQDKMNSKPAQMSGGECQRTAIARAIVHEPALLLADEPTANLDSQSTSTLLDLMAEMNKKENITFLFSTHDQRVIDKARRVITIEDGKIICDEKR